MTTKLPQADENKIETTAQLAEAIKEIDFVESCIDFQWRFEIEELWTGNPKASYPPKFLGPNNNLDLRGWLVNTCFRRPDTNSGEIGEGPSRQEFVPVGVTPSGVFKTCYLLVYLTTWHEIMESMIFKGFRPFDPHNTVDELNAIQAAKREAIGSTRRKNFVTIKERQ